MVSKIGVFLTAYIRRAGVPNRTLYLLAEFVKGWRIEDIPLWYAVLASCLDINGTKRIGIGDFPLSLFCFLVARRRLGASHKSAPITPTWSDADGGVFHGIGWAAAISFLSFLVLFPNYLAVSEK